MNPWLETLGVILLAVAGGFAGCWFSRLPRSFWLLGYFLPFSLILVRALAMHIPALEFVPPISWMMLGRVKFAIVGLVTTMVLTTPLSRLPQRRDRVAVCVLMIWIVLQTSVWPFLAPAFNRNYLATLKTKIDSDGICLQSNDYNCGPATAVTALRKLGLPAEEGQIALLAHTTSATGTPPDILAQALQKQYGAQGLVCEYRLFKDIAELKGAGLTLVIVKYSFMLDHYLTVLEVNDNAVIVGDPLTGITKLTRDEFREKWRHCGIVLKRNSKF